MIRILLPDNRTLALPDEFVCMTAKQAARYLAALGYPLTRHDAWLLQEVVRVLALEAVQR